MFEDIRSDVEISDDLLAGAFLEADAEGIGGILARNGFVLGSRVHCEKKMFFTEDPRTLFIEFAFRFSCEPVAAVNEEKGVLEVSGDGFYDADTRELRQLRSFGEKLTIRSPDQTERVSQNHRLFPDSLVIGHKTVREQSAHTFPVTD